MLHPTLLIELVIQLLHCTVECRRALPSESVGFIITGRKHAIKSGRRWLRESLRSRLYGNRGAKILALQGINDARHWRDRAASMRVLSDQIKDPEARRMMLKLANDYDKIAEPSRGSRGAGT